MSQRFNVMFQQLTPCTTLFYESTSAMGHEFVSGVDIETINDPSSIANTGTNTASNKARYSQSKLYNVLFAKALARRLGKEEYS